MARRHDSRRRRHREAAPAARRPRARAPSGSAAIGGSLIDGPGKHQRAQRRRPCGSAAAPRRAQRVRRQPADIAVGGELAPGPAFVGRLVDGDALAHQRLGVERRVGRRARAAAAPAASITSRASPSTKRAAVDLALEMLGGEIGARRREARIEVSPRQFLRLARSARRRAARP